MLGSPQHHAFPRSIARFREHVPTTPCPPISHSLAPDESLWMRRSRERSPSTGTFLPTQCWLPVCLTVSPHSHDAVPTAGARPCPHRRQDQTRSDRPQSQEHTHQGGVEQSRGQRCGLRQLPPGAGFARSRTASRPRGKPRCTWLAEECCLGTLARRRAPSAPPQRTRLRTHTWMCLTICIASRSSKSKRAARTLTTVTSACSRRTAAKATSTSLAHGAVANNAVALKKSASRWGSCRIMNFGCGLRKGKPEEGGIIVRRSFSSSPPGARVRFRQRWMRPWTRN